MKIIKTSTAPTEPGIYAGITNADYHAGPGISKSGLDLLARSPLHYWHRYISGLPGERTETAAMRFGTAVHAAILEPEDYARWVVMPKVDRRFKEGKAIAEVAEARAAQEGVRIIEQHEHSAILDIAAAVRGHPVIGQELATGVAEVSVYWIDEETGVFCRCRPDWLGAGLILDVKTTENAEPSAFLRSAYTYRYWVQAAFYLDGVAANGLDIGQFMFAAVEKAAPYAVMAYNASPALIEAGRREYKRLLRLYADCATANRWPGYGDTVEMDLPPWAVERLPDDNAIASDFS